jgi:monothiol glutaredoxin
MSVHDMIEKTVTENKIVLYMKGSPAMPQCGFSAAAVQILKKIGKPFQSVNVLADAAVREGIKTYANWPTIPQLYVGGKFVGGCDIMREMDASGELQKLVEAAFAGETARA